MANDVVVRNDQPLSPLPEVVNSQTGEIVTTDPYAGISQLALSREEADKLGAPIPVDDLDILPTGEVYASQIRYRRILNDVFGPGAWGLRPMTDPKIHGQTIMRVYALYCRGVYVSEAPGECDYHASNSRMSYATALEAAKSNALVRCCKDLGIASECWDRRFTEAFKAEHCVRRDGKWYRKGNEQTATPTKRQDQQPSVSSDLISDAQRRRMFAIWAKAGHDNDDVKVWMKHIYGYESSKDVLRKDYEAICARLEDPTPLNEPEPPAGAGEDDIEIGELG